MGNRKVGFGEVSKIVALRDRIDQWRASGRPGKRMPEELWQSAVALGREHGASAVSGELGVNYARLRRRMSAEQGVSARPDTAGEQAAGAHFVEFDVGGMLGGSVGDGQRSELVLERADGTRLSLRLGAGEALDVGAVTAVRLYVRGVKGEPIVCIDEKTGMQALSRSRDLQPAARGRAGRQDFEYRRNGTRCLFACFNIGTGKVLGRCTHTRKRVDFLSFLDLVASTYRQRRVHVVLDNLNTHRDTSAGSFISDWNRRHGNRFVFHYTPTHGSWLNQVELWFAIVAKRVLRHASFASCDELVAAIERFIERWNTTEAHPFRWTYQGLPLVR